jgi:hypothetical protein
LRTKGHSIDQCFLDGGTRSTAGSDGRLGGTPCLVNKDVH